MNLPALVTPAQAKAVWDRMDHPSTRRMATALTQSGRPVHFSTVARWKALIRLAILANVDDVNGALEVHDTMQAAGALSIDVIASEIRLAEDIAPALANLHGPALALYVVADALTNTHASEISALALAARKARAGGQPQHRQGARSHRATQFARYRRRGDRIWCRCCGARVSSGARSGGSRQCVKMPAMEAKRTVVGRGQYRRS
jgi:hypothetical protein